METTPVTAALTTALAQAVNSASNAGELTDDHIEFITGTTFRFIVDTPKDKQTGF